MTEKESGINRRRAEVDVDEAPQTRAILTETRRGCMVNHELRVLQAYASGELSRATAMEGIGVDWYGDLLVRMNAAELRVTEPSSADKQRMRESVAKVFGTES